MGYFKIVLCSWTSSILADTCSPMCESTTIRLCVLGLIDLWESLVFCFTNSATVKILFYVLWQTCIHPFLVVIVFENISRIIGSGGYIYAVIIHATKVFSKRVTPTHTHTCTVLVYPYLCQHLLLSIFFIFLFLAGVLGYHVVV